MISLTTRLLDRIMNLDNTHTFNRTTDSLEAIANAIAALGFGPGVSLWMFGQCDAAMVASQTVITTDNLTAVLPDDLFNNEFYMVIIHNADVPGTAPEGEWRRIANYVGATQTFTTDAFSANVEATDLVMIVHESILFGQPLARGTLDTSSTTVPADSTRTDADDYFKGNLLMMTEGAVRFQPRPIREYTGATGVFTLDEPFTAAPGLVDYVVLPGTISIQRLIDIFTIVNGLLTTTEAGGTITTDGTEQNVYINNAPAGVYEPLSVAIDLTSMTAAESITVRSYYRIRPAPAALIQSDEVIYAGVQAIPLIFVDLEPTRYGIQVTLECTVGGPIDVDWGAIYRV